jgi:hypothetical protein
VRLALRRFSKFAGGAVLVAHNACFDVGFVNRELERMTGKRLHATVIDTVSLARNLLGRRSQRTSLAALSYFFGVSVQPCHRALPDAQATSEVFLRLLELAQERGASTLSELEELAAPRPRRIHAKRRLIHGAPTRPGVYLFHAADGRVLYVGKARDLRMRLRSYFHSQRQRPAVEAALDEVDRIEWRVLGSELTAALEEVSLIRRLRPPANARTPSPESYVYLHCRGSRIVLSAAPSPFGPLRRKADARRAAQALKGCSGEELDALLDGVAPDRVRERIVTAVEVGHELDARRLMRQLASLERIAGELARVDRVRRLAVCLLVPDGAYVVQGGRVTRHHDLVGFSRLPEAAVVDADRLDELLVAASFLDSPPPELTIVQL